MSQDQPIKKATSLQSEKEVQEVPKEQPKPKYSVPKGEEGIFHVELEPRSGRFDTETGRKRHKAFIQKFHPRDFALQIGTNDRGEPVFATVGWRVNKVLHVPDAKFLEGVVVNTVKERKVVKVPIAEALEYLNKIIKAQDEEAKQ
jgi:hypothetical protein